MQVMDIVIDLPFILILSVCGVFVQECCGSFAAGLTIIPALLWFGISIPAAQCALLVASIPQNIWGVWSFRDSIAAKDVTWPAVGRLVFFPAGIAVVYQLDARHPNYPANSWWAIDCVNALDLVVQPAQNPSTHLHPIWAWIAFPLSGFMQGVVGMAVRHGLWVQAHDWGTRRSRGFLLRCISSLRYPL